MTFSISDLAFKNAGAWGAGSGEGTAGRLTSTQGDNNIYTLGQAILDAIAAATAVGIDPDNPVTISGDQLTFHFSDSSETTITLPTAMPVWRGDFAAVSYAVADWFFADGAIYRVLVAHTGELPFDPGRSITGGGDYYAKVLDVPSIPGVEVSDATFTPATTNANQFIVCTNSNTAGTGDCVVTIDSAQTFPDWCDIMFRDETDLGVSFTVTGSASILPQYGCNNVSAGKGSTIQLKKFGSTDAWFIFGLLQPTTA